MQVAVLKSQDISKVEALLKQGVDVNAPIGCGGFSPLDGAIYRENVAMLKFLLAHGAKPSAGNLAGAAFADGGQQALEMTKALIAAGMDPNTRTSHGNNALMSATYQGNEELVAFLLSQPGIKLDKYDIDDGFTALMWAVKHGNTEIVDMLLKAGANPFIANKEGETAITVAKLEIQEIQKQKDIISKLQAVPRK